MKKNFKKILLFIFLFIIHVTVTNAATKVPCAWDNVYYNPTEIRPGYPGTDTSETLIYEITRMQMNGDVLEIYGWAFNSVYDTELTGWKVNDGNASISLTWYPSKYKEDDFDKIKANEKVKMNITYATRGSNCSSEICPDGSPKYYDLTYVNCYKGRDDNTGVRYCMNSNSGNHNNKYGSATPQLRGGFKATINLKESYENGAFIKGEEYRLRLEFGMLKKIGGQWGDAKDVAVSKYLTDPEVENYQFTGGDNVGKIAVSGLSKSVTITSDAVIPNGPSGYSCGRGEGEKNLGLYTYFYQNREYNLGEKIIKTCRGPAGYCKNQSEGLGAVNMYEIKNGGKDKYNRISPQGSYSYYVPVSFLELKGNITLKVEKSDDEDDPGVCEGEEIYYLYYYMMDGIPDDFKGNIDHNSLFKDAEVLKKLNFNSNIDFSDEEGGFLSTKTVKKDFDKFYDNFWKAIESGNGYIEDGGKYYLIPSEFYKWKSGNNIGETYTFSKDKGTDKNSYVPYDVKLFQRKGLNNGLGYTFHVKGTIDYSDKNNKPLSIKSGTNALAKDNLYKQFTVYQQTVCRDKQKTPQCPDTVDSAQCIDNDTGTVFTFNENDDKTICTLPKDNHSGFVAIEEGETNGYCSMACKEDLEGYLPTTKETAAGQYFKLDNYVPKIKANRTCVTSKIDYSKFDSQKKGMEKGLIDSYNLYQDWLAYHKGMVSRDNLTKSGGGGVMSCPDQNGDYIDNIVPHYSYKYWEVDAFSGPTGMKSWGFMTENYAGTCGYTCNSSGGIDPVSCNGQTLAKYKESVKNDTIGAKDSFNGVQDDYSDLFNSYNRCFNWAEITNDTRTSGGGGGVEPAKEINRTTSNNISNYLYSFEPKVTFNYPDPDGSIFPVEYEYKYGTRDVDMVGFNRVNDFWPYMATPSNKYDDGGASLDPDSAQYFIKCTGQKCTEGMKVSIPIYRNGAVRRDEKVEYTYHLPDVFTSVPSGRVTTKPAGSGAFLQLDKEAVPVNINTFAGTYNYQIKIADLKDELRLSKEGNNPDDNFEKRFNGSEAPGALNEGEDYVCHYKVVNDIYLPGPQKFNFFYRVVDTYEINPLNRTLGYNWTTGKAQKIRKTIQEDALSYETLTNSPNREKFVFTLTPVTMQSIRRYNARQTIEDDGYADWDLECADYGERVSGVSGYHCTSNFITCLAGGYGDKCSEIVGDAHDNGDYTDEDLKHNRDLLINKQNELDGRG